MKSIAKLVIILCVTLMAGVQEASAQYCKGQTSVGVKAGFITRNSSPVAGLSLQYGFSNRFRIAPNAEYIFRHHGVDAFAFNLDAHFPITSPAHPKVTFYPLAGLSYTNWSHRTVDPETDDDVTNRKSRLGLNFGAGLEYYFTSSLKVSVEAKFNWVKSYSAGVFTAGIAYVF